MNELTSAGGILDRFVRVMIQNKIKEGTLDYEYTVNDSYQNQVENEDGAQSLSPVPRLPAIQLWRSTWCVCSRQEHTAYDTPLEEHLVRVQQVRAHSIRHSSGGASCVCTADRSTLPRTQLWRSILCMQLTRAHCLGNSLEAASCMC